MTLDVLVTNTASITTVLGFLALLVYIIVEQTKEVGILKYIPTKIYTIAVSMVVTYLSLFGCLMYKKDSVTPSLFVFAFLGSFVVAFIANNGWQIVYEIKDRFMPKNK